MADADRGRSKKRVKRKSRTLQRIRRRTVYWGARAAQAFLLVLPFDTAIGFGAWLGRVAFHVLRGERQKTLKQLAIAFGLEKKESELRAIARGAFENAGRCVAELMVFPRWTEARLRQRIQRDEATSLVETARSGKGVILLTAHFGNWELAGACLSRILSADVGVIARRLSNPHLNALINRQRERMGMKVFIRGEGGAKFYRHLTRGGTLAILGDHDMKGIEGIFVDFFGRPAHTATGPAELILRSGRPWFFGVLQRLPDGRSHRMRVQGPLPVPDGEDHDIRVRRLTEDYMRRLEEVVRERPDQWMWMHDRWKKKPEETAET